MLAELLMVAAQQGEPQYEQQYERHEIHVEHRQPDTKLAWQCHLITENAWKCKWQPYDAQHEEEVRDEDRRENAEFEQHRDYRYHHEYGHHPRVKKEVWIYDADKRAWVRRDVWEDRR